MNSIDIYIDFKSPAAYLALAPTRALLARTGASANWRPFDTRLATVPRQKTAENKGEKHRRVRALARRDVHRLYADIQGLPMIFQDPPFDAKLAVAMLACLEHQPHKQIDTFIDTAFKWYWQDQQNLNEPDVLAALLQEVRIDIPLPEPSGVTRILTDATVAAHDRGVIETPAYLVAGQVFIGREHLPWIEELLSANADN
ncbi:MAG: DsbA family protein [bacterium]